MLQWSHWRFYPIPKPGLYIFRTLFHFIMHKIMFYALCQRLEKINYTFRCCQCAFKKLHIESQRTYQLARTITPKVQCLGTSPYHDKERGFTTRNLILMHSKNDMMYTTIPYKFHQDPRALEDPRHSGHSCIYGANLCGLRSKAF